MNEPFLLSNLIDLQDIDNKIYNIENEKKGSENVKKLMSLESEFNEITKKINIQKNEIASYYTESEEISVSSKSINLKIKGIKLKLEDKSLDANELLNYTKQKESSEMQLSQLETKLSILNRNNQDELNEIRILDESMNEVKKDLIEVSRLVKDEWKNIDEKLSIYESEKAELLSTFPQRAQDLYDDLKARGVDVIAAYRLENHQCGCCGVDLTTSELDSIFKTEFQQCPYCDGILV
tara:strand:+ start:1886 stop:2596 length:711 start_codon:yes stop_codon:yes gene_type:complete